MKRLSRALKIRLRWRDFVPLSNLGLAQIDERDSETLASFFGASFRNVRTTPKGDEVARAIIANEVSFWKPTADKHAAEYAEAKAQNPKAKWCICFACLAGRRAAKESA